jgi:uncharacterized membrane protein HdeD (DUF308 family)
MQRMERMMGHWWVLTGRGGVSLVVAVLLGFASGWSSLGALAFAFGLYAFFDGAGSLAFVFGARKARIATYVARGILGIATGALAFAATSAPALYLVVAAWGLGTGALEMAFGSRSWAMPNALGLMLVGVLSFAFGLTALIFSLESVVTLRAFLVVYLFVNGVASTAVGEWSRVRALDPVAMSHA